MFIGVFLSVSGWGVCFFNCTRAFSSISLRGGPEQLSHWLKRQWRPKSDHVGYCSLAFLPPGLSWQQNPESQAFKPRALDVTEGVPGHCHYCSKPSMVIPFLLPPLWLVMWPRSVSETKEKSTDGFGGRLLRKVFLSDQRKRHTESLLLPLTSCFWKRLVWCVELLCTVLDGRLCFPTEGDRVEMENWGLELQSLL